MSHFKTTRRGILVVLTPEERVFLGDVVPLLVDVGSSESDPAAARLHVPVYLDDPASNNEWWRLMGGELDLARNADRKTFTDALQTDSGPMSIEEANSFLRVLNEARLALGARLGIEVDGDHERLPEESRHVLDYLGWLQEELTVELTKSL